MHPLTYFVSTAADRRPFQAAVLLARGGTSLSKTRLRIRAEGRMVVAEVSLPTGTRVRVETIEARPADEPLGRKLHALDGMATRLPNDLAQNHDHYLHGKPKRPVP
jgi:hypothetical protein